MPSDAKRLPGTSAEPTQNAGEFLSDLLASPGDWRRAMAVVLVLAMVFAATAPYAKAPLPAVWGFIPTYQAALVVIESVTAVMLFGEFRYVGAASLLALGAGYLFSAFMAAAHALSFPGLFAPTGIIGDGSQTTAWLYFFWHAGFPVFLMAYARLGERRVPLVVAPRRRRAALAWTCAGVTAAVLASAWLAARHTGALPVLMQGDVDDSAKVVVATATWMLGVLALIVLGARRRHTVLDVWCMVVACVWVFEVALAAVLNGARFDVGFYAGRIYGLLAGSFVLCVLLLEHSRLFARLLAAHGRERSERAAAEQRTRELSLLNRELDAFTYSVSHDLRAPLRAIEGYAAILESEHGPALDTDARRSLGAVRRAAARMEQMIEGLLRLARLGRTPLTTQPTDLDELVRERVAEARERCAAAGAVPDFRLGHLGIVHADASLLQHVFDNLVGNAIKYTAGTPGAAIEIGRLGATGTRSDEAVFFVRDNGVGFDMQYADKLFGVFQRLHSGSRYEGHGIGLAIVQRVVQRHGGRVWAESSPGKGATFYFSLRTVTCEEARVAAQTEPGGGVPTLRGAP